MGSDAAFRVFSAAAVVTRRWTATVAVAVPVTPNSLIPSRSLRPSFYLSTRVIPHAWLRGAAAHAQATRTDGRPCLMVNPRDKEEPTTTISQPWGTKERAARKGERGHGTGLQLSQILRHLPRTRSTGHSDPLNPGSTMCTPVLPCNLLFSLSRHPSVVPPSFLPCSVPPPPGIKS